MRNAATFALPTRTLALFLGALLIAVTVFASATSAQAKKPGSGTGSLPVTGTLSDGGSFEGTISDLNASVNDAGDLVVSGVLNGTATDAAGDVTQITDQAFTTTATLDQGGACDILFLDLGPISLDLLGLTVDLSQITLDVNAVPGAGNLLGNLLCAVAGLLDNTGGGATNGIANLLNQIFSLLG
ncbi:MAG TPA: hypothetical protein VHM69_14375 [Rubrobacter sp.]|nr:hypothetical protein [Rubrobacter sp.]